MDLISLILFLMIGALSGWLIGTAMKKGGFGLLGNIGIGSAGGVAGGFLFRLLDVVVGGLVGSLATTAVGAVIFLYVFQFLKNAWRSFNPSTEEM